MKNFNKLALLLVLMLVLGRCGSEKIGSTEVKYDLKVTFNWTSSNHPSGLGSFPDKAHFSPVIGSVHKTGKAFYKVGSIASSGVKLMAETGNISSLTKELNNQVVQDDTYDPFIGNIGKATGEERVDGIRAYGDFCYVSLVSMLAPSPDWFIAASDINLKDASGNWKETLNVDMHGYDAGTDSGTDFTATDKPTTPPENIKRFTGSNDIVFATATFTKQQ